MVEKDNETTTNLGSIFLGSKYLLNQVFPEDVGLGSSLGYFTIFCYFFLSTLVYFITTKRYHFHENIFN